ncbi:MBL fold metallo-hydrolase [Spirosoma utsteinense]|uniref:Glyoxylase-like metal-dependent hydrolase (Beta-lactamase superfamily II) n=1 Tax=Spirosoma utsteinense TaxID=2585773 RepID=A0ABR6W748_9BACT|nr:MBL fold metallo-hydrolase [Spirosoma utsteinense]MBC3786128.1 glyoxylase-like metal-dependent hydrolase (beta-lactamase superfamily II) [Spirosoma utsteinense]MBC3792317.1 glyoxylase-like metal-dependent hydrolase (beta-lactamase superfamily II) [Spirosoma utsteinense]
MIIKSIDTGPFKLDGGAMFGVVPKSIWQRTNPADERNLCDWALRNLLVEATDANGRSRLLLVDTGAGDKQDAKFFSYYDLPNGKTLTSAVEQAGYSINDVTDVLLTHLHFDHAGGAVRYADSSHTKLEATFPQATYWSHSGQWEWATAPNPRERATYLKENFMPLHENDQLRFIDRDGLDIPGIDLLYMDGHTEKMTLPMFQVGTSQPRTAVFCADLIPSAAHIPIPYVMGYDVRPLVTMDEKTSFLNRAVDENWLLIFDHDPTCEAATVERTEKGIRIKERGALAEWL